MKVFLDDFKLTDKELSARQIEKLCIWLREPEAKLCDPRLVSLVARLVVTVKERERQISKLKKQPALHGAGGE